ncbi:MAG TPA: hypothetical protein VF487_20370 [Chitinophagaceae bacterium]
MPPKKSSEYNKGYIPINRKFFDHLFWKEKRTFSKSEAWLDLIAGARFEESQATELIGGRLVSWTKGQLPVSLRYLSERWMWSKSKVDGFLKLLEGERMVIRKEVNGQTILTLCNYSAYNQKGQQKGHLTNSDLEDSDEQRDSKKEIDGTATGQRQDKTNKVNKEKDVGINANTHTPIDESMFKAFTGWIQNHAVNVSKMKEPFTIDQYLQLRKKIPDRGKVQDLLLKMHNWQPLLKKNNSAYLTILNWSKNDFNNSTLKAGKDKTVVL